MQFIKLSASLLFLFLSFISKAQDDQLKKIMQALSDSSIAKIDTATPPNDSFTKSILQLRKERGSFNVQQMGIYKLKEEQAKNKDVPPAFYDSLIAQITNGNAARLIHNSIINLYRKYFTEQDVKELTKFYKTAAGKKMSSAFPVVMILSAKSMEMIIKATSEKLMAQLKAEGKIK